MTAEEKAAVEWLEGLSADEHLEHFRPAIGGSELFTLKHDHETTRSGYCRQCQGTPRVVVDRSLFPEGLVA